jgi:hypothetical protein
MANCERSDCKGWAKHGSRFCASHDPNTRHAGGAPAGNINGLLGGLAALFSEEERDALESFTPGRLNSEIAVLRVILIRSLHEDNRDRVIATTNALVKAEQVQHRISGNQASDLIGAMETVLAELGVGDGK